MMKYNFDEIINRHNTNAMSVDGFREYLFEKGDELNFPCGEEDFVMMWVADMEFATAPEIVNALKERVEHGIFGYSKVFDKGYKAAFNHWTKTKYNYEFNLNYLVTSHGVIPALYDLISYTCQPNEKILILTPSYAFFKHGADFHNIEIVTSDLIEKEGRFCMDLDDIRKKTSDEKVTLCIFCNPHNPTGRLWTPSELWEFGEICFENKVLIISDEVHCDLLREGKTFTPLQKVFPNSDQIITCMAPSKTFNLAGMMLANIMIPNDKLRNKWNERHLSMDNPLSITAAKAAYSLGTPWLEELKNYLDDNFEFLSSFLKEYLPQAQFKIPDSTYLAWIDVSAYFPKEENLTLFFANKAGVLLEGGNMFVANATGYIRLNLACPRSRLKIGLERIKKAIEGYHSKGLKNELLFEG